MLAVTGAPGHLGRLVVDQLLQKLPAAQLVAAVRNAEKARDLAARGVEVRRADYDAPETLDAAFQGVDQLLLFSATELGKRGRQHRAAIAASTTGPSGSALVVLGGDGEDTEFSKSFSSGEVWTRSVAETTSCDFLASRSTCERIGIVR